ncbi:transcriptional regulator [Enterobacter cloacae complex sp. 413K2]
MTQTEIAKNLGTTSQAVSLWLNHEVPAHRVLPICKLLGWKITPHEVRSDIYPNPTANEDHCEGQGRFQQHRLDQRGVR